MSDTGECFILGNGPSLKDDLEKNVTFLQTQKLVVVNNFARSDYYVKLKPQYYVFADPAYWSDEKNKVVDSCRSTLETIRDNTTWEMKIFVPHAAFKTELFKEFFIINNRISLVAYNTTFISERGFENLNHYLYKKNLAAPRIQNVLMAAIFISINIGLSEINLLGSDHSWTKELFVNSENQVCILDHHFYDKKKQDFNIFTRVDGSIYKMHEILRDYAFMFEGYHSLRGYGDVLGVKIYNNTSNSFIDAFERKQCV
ncbi:hypothetical protein [Flavobacterium sp. TAB 87]|uniref:hypothetical protein n=1 Tax=Flavobacterium sp. TAB 87 TaxID=1729581 RepID=UPI0012F87481|nr:hypothetical protein [Flavobacterium sp. TAB 87]